MTNKTKLLLCGILLVVLVCSAFFYTTVGEEPVENAGTAQNAVVESTFLTYQGNEYPIKPRIQTVLLIGTDGAEAYQKEYKLLDYYNFSQADFLMLMVLDRDSNTADFIQLNRDTMAHVPWLDVLGRFGGTEFKQICLAFNYGDGGRKSCQNTVDAASRLLFNAPIDHYIQIPLSAIAVINDLVGGVPVTIPEDLTAIDPAFTEGAAVRLNGLQAEKFVRARMELSDDTNVSRMNRQRIYLDSFQNCARMAFHSDSEFALKVVEKLAEYLQSDLTAQQLSDLITRLDQADVQPIRTPTGLLTQGEAYYEYYVDEESLWELVKDAYCQE